MAEFAEVMKHVHRMCMEFASYCRFCPLGNEHNSCGIDAFSDRHFDTQAAQELENIIMGWAKEHPEPMYPSWTEGWKQIYPNAEFLPCAAAFNIDCLGDCPRCREQPVPAVIAEKLGIKPIVKEEKA